MLPRSRSCLQLRLARAPRVCPSYRNNGRFASTSRSPIPEIFDVICVGGGPAGLAIAAGLRANPSTSALKVAVIEGQDLEKSKLLHPSPTKYSNRCSSIVPASVHYLREIGAWEHIHTDRVQPYQEMQVWDGMTDARISFDWNSSFSYLSPPVNSETIAYMIENLNLTNALLARLDSLGGTEIFSSTRVESIELGEDSPEVDLSSWPVITLNNGRTIAARLLIGADGVNSPVRTFANINTRGWDYNRNGVVATLRLEGPGWAGDAYKIAYQRFLPSGPIAMLPLPGNMASLVWSTLPERAARLKSLSSEDFVAMVNAAFRLSKVDIDYMHTIPSGQADELAWREKHTSVDANTIPMRVTAVQEGTVAPFPLRMRHADTYTGERVALVGDAAHTTHPLAGQGLNLGLADAASLVRTIGTAVESGADIGSTLSLEQYNDDRYAANNMILGVCDKLHKLYSVESGPIVWGRSLGLNVINNLGPLKDIIMKRASGMS